MGRVKKNGPENGAVDNSGAGGGVVMVDVRDLPTDENDSGGKTNEGFDGVDESTESSMVNSSQQQTDEIETSQTSMQVNVVLIACRTCQIT